MRVSDRVFNFSSVKIQPRTRPHTHTYARVHAACTRLHGTRNVNHSQPCPSVSPSLDAAFVPVRERAGNSEIPGSVHAAALVCTGPITGS